MPSLAFYSLAVLIVLADQLTKLWVKQGLPVGGSIPLWAGVFHFTHTQNRGMAFSLLEGKIGLLAVAALIVVGIIVVTQVRLRKRMPLLLGLALALPLGGAIGNLIDRIVQGYVTDFLDFRLINFPVFNVADSAITVGVLFLAWHTLTTPDEPAPAPATEGHTQAHSTQAEQISAEQISEENR
jgi:signal peptidase II